MQDGEGVADIPWHFARGLLEEERGNPVNWMAMAYNRMLKGCANRSFVHYVQPLPFRFPRVPVSNDVLLSISFLLYKFRWNLLSLLSRRFFLIVSEC
jgi:hypothetical protein